MELLTVKELAARLKVTPRQCYKLAAAGRLPKPVKLARSTRWKATDLTKFFEADCDMRRFEAERGRT